MATNKWLVVINIPENSFFCSTQEINSYRFETMWGWVKRELKKNNIGYTIPLIYL